MWKEGQVAHSLVKLAVLRPRVLFELAGRRVDAMGVHHGIGDRSVQEIEIQRAEQRDHRLSTPFVERLGGDADFRERARRVAEGLLA